MRKLYSIVRNITNYNSSDKPKIGKRLLCLEIIQNKWEYNKKCYKNKDSLRNDIHHKHRDENDFDRSEIMLLKKTCGYCKRHFLGLSLRKTLILMHLKSLETRFYKNAKINQPWNTS